MRGYKEVINQVLKFANNDESIRVVMINGSRVNVNAPVDIMQDYDIVFFTTSIENLTFKKHRDWINQFGEIVILQQNDFEDGSYIFLMQFKDGVRIDLRFCDIKRVNEIIKEDTLTKILLDKDNVTDEVLPPNESIYLVKKPTINEWNRLLNNSWWIQTYIAKGIWRDELPYVKYMFDVILINSVSKLLSWYIGMRHDWNINVGKCGKWYKRLLEPSLYNRYASLYSGIAYVEIWDKLFNVGDFIRDIGTEVSTELGYEYPMNEDKNVTEFIARIKELPKDAKGLK